MRKIIAALLLSLVIAPVSVAQSGAAEQALSRLEDEWARAVRQSDTAALDTIIGADYVGTTADGEVQGKADYIADFVSGDRRVFALTTDDLDVRIYDHVAVLTHGGRAEAEYRGEPVVGEFRWTHVFVARDGRWQAVANHVTRIAPP